MEHVNRKLIRLKENELATLAQRTSERRSTLERELATLDEHARQERTKLEQEISVLHQAAQIEEETLSASKAPVKVYTRQEREELFAIRSQVMRRLLESAHGREVHAKDLAEALHRPESTIKDYFNEQLEMRPMQCFWQNGIDKAHFRWKDGYSSSSGQPSRVSHTVQSASEQPWHASVS